jgi:hypothetical protein
MNNKILIINPLWPNMIHNCGIDVLQTKQTPQLFLRFIHAIHIRSKLPGKRIWNVKKWWKKCNSAYDLIILMDSSPDIVYQTKKIEQEALSNTRLILYLLNPISHIGNQYIFLSKRWEIWSFSKKDSCEIGFKCGETFYFKEFAILNENIEIKYDSFFIGLDKERINTLNELKTIYTNQNLDFLFYIVDNKKSFYNSKYHKRIPYQEVIKLIQASKSITEIVQQNQEGMTLRTMESIFLKRKLISTNPSIKTRRIYNSNNIFILGEDDNAMLSQFVNTPYEEISSKEIEKYEFTSWLKRIIDNKEFE